MTELQKIEEFTLFILLHMGHVDGSLHPNERDTIVDRMKQLFPEHPSVEESLIEMEVHYRSLKYGSAEIILKEGFQKFSHVDPAKRLEIYASIFDIINANGRINEEETQTLQFMKTWFTAG